MKDSNKLPKIDLKVQRRFLRFINAARRPEDLLAQPTQVFHVHAEHRGFKRPELHEPLTKPKQKILFDMKVAKQLIEFRDEISPMVGLTNIKPILDIIPLNVFRHIIWFFGRASRGEWSVPINIPAEHDRPVHAALLRTGKVLFFGLPDGNKTTLWVPSPSGPGTFSVPQNQPVHSLFCSGHSFLSDGKFLAAGGGGDGTVTIKHNHVWKFDPKTETWEQTRGNDSPNDTSPTDGDMSWVRWYPTLVTLGDEPGRVLVVSGNNGRPDVPQMEMYFESSDRFEKVWGHGGLNDESANRSFPQLYPGLNLLPGGEIFYTPTGWHSGGSIPTPYDYPEARPSTYFEFSSTSTPVTGSWTDMVSTNTTVENAIDRVKGMAVLLIQNTYPFVQVMVVGGGADPESTTTYQIINLSTFSPEWGPPLPLPDGLSRVNVNLVLLPDGRVFLCGGRPLSDTTPRHGGVCWIYDPSRYEWYEMDELNNSRRYHSVALLLPDGRVMAAGDQTYQDRTIELFSPSYLFNTDGTLADPPAISSAPELVHHGSSFSIETPNADSISKMVFVRPMAVTHQTDSEQRVIPLPFTKTGTNTITSTAPNGWHPHALAPKGWYMLFIINDLGVPSVAKFIFLH